jgi:hypothetical protein
MTAMPWIESHHWQTGYRFVRDDGAVVKMHTGPEHLQWIAYEPDPSEQYLIRYSKRGMGWPRRWGTAKAAMKAVDREFPIYSRNAIAPRTDRQRV